MRDLFKQRLFLQNLFDAIPILTLVLDDDSRVRAANKTAKDFLGCKEEEILFNRCGEAISCRHATDHPLGCGFGPSRNECIIRKAVLASRKDKLPQRLKGKLELLPDKNLSVLVSASSFEYNSDIYFLVMIEDISFMAELEGLIPICASCKRIRDEKGYWNLIERFIEEHSEAEFTHDICPDCIRRMYPEIDLKDDTQSICG